LKGHKKPPQDPAKHSGPQPARGGPADDTTLEGQLKLQLAALADYRAVVAKHPNPHASAAIAGMEAAVGDLRAKIDAQKSPEARLQAAMSRQAAALKDFKATEAEVQKLAVQLQDAMDLKEAQAAKLATLSAEVAELKLRTLPAPAPSPPAPAVNLDALLGLLTQRGIAVTPEVWAGCLVACSAPAVAPAEVRVEPPTAPAAAPEVPAAAAMGAPAPAGSEGGEAPMVLDDADGRGRKREADGGGRTTPRRSKSACPVADTSVQDMLLRARGIPVQA
jgi:hypothetical protein